MGLFNRKKDAIVISEAPEKKAYNESFTLTSGGFQSISALYTNELDVLNNSAVWSAVRYLGMMVSTMPLHVFKKENGSREIDNVHPVAQVLQNPNPYMTKSVFIETMEINFELFGVAYAEITWTTGTLKKYPKMLLPISPKDIQVVSVEGDLKYLYLPTGTYIPKENLLIVMGTSLNGILPLNPVKYMKSSLELSRAGEELQKRYFQKGTMMGGIITVPSNFSVEEKQRIKTSFDNAFSGGVSNSFGTVVLNEGLKYEPVKFSAEDTQLLESRNFTIQDVARRFGVSPYALGDLSHATFSNIEHQGINDIKNTFRPRIVKFEEAMNQVLFNSKDKNTYYIRFSMEGLLRGDTNTRYAAYNIALQTGFMTRNEIRALEDLNPVEGADDLFVPLNMVSLKVANEYNPLNSVEAVEASKKKVEEQVEILDEKYYLNERSHITQASKAEIEKLVRKMLKQEIELLNSELSGFEAKGLEGFKKDFTSGVGAISKTFEADFQNIFATIANRLNPIIAKELKKEQLTSAEDIKTFVDKYTTTFIHRHSGKIIGDIYKVVEKTSPASAIEDIENITNDWKMNLPAQTRDEESVRASNAFTKTLFVAYGVMKMKSVASGDACPICRSLDGKIVSIEGSFINKDTDFEDEEGNVVHFRKNFSHPPFHNGCSCGIAPA